MFHIVRMFIDKKMRDFEGSVYPLSLCSPFLKYCYCLKINKCDDVSLLGCLLLKGREILSNWAAYCLSALLFLITISF